MDIFKIDINALKERNKEFDILINQSNSETLSNILKESKNLLAKLIADFDELQNLILSYSDLYTENINKLLKNKDNENSYLLSNNEKIQNSSVGNQQKIFSQQMTDIAIRSNKDLIQTKHIELNLIIQNCSNVLNIFLLIINHEILNRNYFQIQIKAVYDLLIKLPILGDISKIKDFKEGLDNINTLIEPFEKIIRDTVKVDNYLVYYEKYMILISKLIDIINGVKKYFNQLITEIIKDLSQET